MSKKEVYSVDQDYGWLTVFLIVAVVLSFFLGLKIVYTEEPVGGLMLLIFSLASSFLLGIELTRERKKYLKTTIVEISKEEYDKNA